MAEQKKSRIGNAFDWGLLKRLLGYSKPYKLTFRSTIFLTVLLAAIAPVRPLLVQYAIDDAIVNLNLPLLVWLTLGMIGLLLIESVIQFLQSYYSSWLGQTIVKDLRSNLFSHVSRFKLQYFDRTPIGTLVTRVINDIETIADIFSEGLLSIIGDLLKLVVVLIVMFAVNWELALMALIPVPVLVIATNMFKNGIKKTFQEVRNEVTNLNTFTQEHITGMQIIQAFNREDIELKKFKEINKRHRRAHIRSVWYYSVFFPVVEILSAISIALVVWWGTRQMINNPGSEITPGLIVAFIQFIYMLYRPMRQLADRFNTLQMGIVSAERVFKLFDTEAAIEDKGAEKIESIRGKIDFDHVNFAYTENDYVLRDVSFSVEPGEKLALVGATGSGKSTIINLLSRMYDIQEGEIRIDGENIKNYELAELQKNIGVVLQDVFLFSDTILNNIRLNNPDISIEQVKEAAKAVGAHDFIMKLPEDYGYNVRERGATLSVGQRQLISFIRAYVFNPKILILDEATSSIDTESEQLIQQATEKITQGRTSIIIAHRLSTIQKADKIIVMEKGRIREIGSHNELIKLNGHYKKLFDLQFAEV